MNQAVLTSIAVTGFVVAFFHAAIPTHWLPFVLTSRVQKWTTSRTLAVTALAGSGHVAVTAILGLAITSFGMRLNESAGAWFTRIAAGLLFCAAGYYALRQGRGAGHVHFGYPHEHVHSERSTSAPAAPARVSDRAAVWSLFAFLTVSPCEAFLPIYASGIRYGWKGFAVLTFILSIGAVIGMVVFTWLSLAGLSRMRLDWMERYESATIALLLTVLGLLVLFFEG
jgi:nickel/cobalt exporter